MLHLNFVAVNLLSFLLGFTLSLTKPSADVHPLPHISGVNKVLMLQLVNDARKKGCQCGNVWFPSAPPVIWNDVLEKAALSHSTDMSRSRFFSHTSPTNGKAGARLQAAGYNWRTYGENIALGYDGEKEVVADWLKSPGHCANIMNPAYKEMGTAKVDGYWTQEFGLR